ncbi:lipid-A-disaccharide synthase [Maribrevibacterium harenarium]|uniref:Lipid-A-disaccharide synthase n=1 Tax=Maribrevibacterium harenarium TaxID=2589817 RepID=A0A501WU35_9GAMM|nr:lipid-A-disaccharide synthase [Maribrevibacterium harenarium]TPE52819.1 lipid-A-disaccharide synthase [Maribrevibacterium harenarium]
MRFVMVAGEASGDILGASLIRALKTRYPDAAFEGIGGPLMIAEGLICQVPMERLSVMGLVEVLGRLRELLGIRKRLYKYCVTQPPTAFIGIDSPDFNLPLARRLRQHGLPTIHYVSPSVWAWRQKRIFKIKQSVDLMLTLFPFELPIYQQHQVPAVCVGHPLADEVPLVSDKSEARTQLGLPETEQIIGVLPGSRGGEVGRLMPVFVPTMELLQQRLPKVQFVIPAASSERRIQIEQALQGTHLPVTIIDGHSRTVMAAADALILASGTAAFEAMLVKRPMVVAYRFSKLTYAIMSRMLKVPYVSLPNLLANRLLVPELLQDAAEPQKLADALLENWQQFDQSPVLGDAFLAIHQSLRLDAANSAADAIQNLLESKPL